MAATKFFIFVVSLIPTVASADLNELLARREQILAEESIRILGGSLTLNSDEKLVNSILMEAKIREYDLSVSSLNFTHAYFFQTKPSMLESEVFQFIRQMPKGDK